ncbi:MAG: 50S ribosomal protein L37ae [Nanoarchaeota archaeon]|nr:50S ribosomal protein L37ae [Nanoarchaeota archaeon]MBU4451905.1 50S ribosomal protein L37ae [Nanoarchaeota archaeon]
MHTKKVGTTGRFGNKYGSRVRHMVAKIEATSRAQHTCPQCLRLTLNRMSAGIWKCKKCKVTIAGGAYQPTTTATKIMKGEVEAFVREAVSVVELVSAVEEKQAVKEEGKSVKKKAAKSKKAKTETTESEEIESKAVEE